MRDHNRYLEQLFGLNELLARDHGWPRFSPWWVETLTDFELSDCRQAVVRKGRRIGASTIVAPQVAVTEALHGGHAIPPNDIGYLSFLSVKRDEAAKRLRGIATVLDAIGQKYEAKDDTIFLVDRPYAFKVQTANYRSSVGDTNVWIWLDELSRWMDSETGANPASEVIASIRPTMLTMPSARMWLVSSPLGLLDAHCTAYERGNVAGVQRVYHCPTWIGNPTITEEMTREIEPSDRVWKREFAAIPSTTSSAVFDPAAIDRAFAHTHEGTSGEPVMICDPSSGKKDTWAYAVARWMTPPIPWPDAVLMQDQDGQYQIQRPDGNWVAWSPPRRDPYLLISHINGIEGRFYQTTSAEEIVGRMAALCQSLGIRHIHSDQRESFSLDSIVRQFGLRFHEHPFTATSKPLGVSHASGLFRSNRIAIEPHEKMRKELLEFEERITPNGQFTFAARGQGHDDYAVLLVIAGLTDMSGGLRDSPYRTKGSRFSTRLPEINARLGSGRAANPRADATFELTTMMPKVDFKL